MKTVNRIKWMKTIHHIAVKRTGHSFVERMVCSWLKGDWEFTCYENMRPQKYADSHSNNGQVVLLQTRDLLNWMASLALQNHNRTGRRLENVSLMNFIQIWMSVEKEFHDATNWLEGYRVILINYDEFFVSRKYRQCICASLNGEYNEKKLNEVKGTGQGSSFDGLEYNGRGQEMWTLDRYKQVANMKGGMEMYRHNLTVNPGVLEFYIRTENLDENKRKFVNEII